MITERDIEFGPEGLIWKPDARCLLSGEPCGVVEVALRKMLLLFSFWQGKQVVLRFPFVKQPHLVGWQYFRMCRWLIVLIGAGMTTEAINARFFRSAESSHWILLAVTLVSFWRATQSLLNKFEIVRLVQANVKKGTGRIRFSSIELADKARQSLLPSLTDAKEKEPNQ